MELTAFTSLKGPLKVISAAKMVIWGFNKYQMARLRCFLATLEAELDDGRAIHKLVEMADNDEHQRRVGQLLERVRRADNIWTTSCLAGVVANYMRKGLLDANDAMLADVLAELTDMDLELFVALKPIAEKEGKEDTAKASEREAKAERAIEDNRARLAAATTVEDKQKFREALDSSIESQFEQSIRTPTIRIDRRNVVKIPFKSVDDLNAVRVRVDRLVRVGALSGNIGGWGNTGVAHGSFMWNPFSEKLYEFVSRFKEAAR